MGWLEGLIGGFTQRKGVVEQENLRQGELAAAREGKIFEALINSPDPEIQGLALTGLLESANPKKRKGGLRGWVGEMESSPYLKQIQTLIGTPVTEERQTLPSRALSPGVPSIQEAPGQQAAAMPANDVVTPGAPPPTPTTMTQTTSRRPEDEAMFQQWYAPHASRLGLDPNPDSPQHFYDYRGAFRAGESPDASGHWPSKYKQEGHPNLIVDGRDTRTGMPVQQAGGPPSLAFKETNQPPQPYSTTRPRQVFRSPAQTTFENAMAEATAEVEGEKMRVAAGLPPRYGGAASAAPYQAIAGTMPDGTEVSAVFDRATGKYRHGVTGAVLEGFVARQTGASSVRFGVNREAIARSKYGKDFRDLDQTEAADVMAEEQRYIESTAQNRVEGAGAGKMNVPADLTTAQTTGVDVGTTAADVAGQRVPSALERARLQGVTAVKTTLEDIQKRLLVVLPRQSDLVGGLLPGAVMMAKRRSRNDREAVAALEAAVNNIVNVVARSVGEQRGTQTEQDALRAEAAIVALRDNILLGDTQESADRRITETITVLNRILGQLPSLPVPNAIGGPPAADATSGLDAPVAGWFVDDQGNLVQR